MNRLMLTLLIILNSISVIVISQVDLGLLPMMSSGLDAERVQRVNNLASNLSQGVLVSTIFYILLVAIPEMQRANRIIALVSPKVNAIISMMEKSILFFMQKTNNASKDIYNLTTEDLNSVTRLSHNKMSFRYKVRSNTGDYWIPFSTGNITEINHFTHERKVVVEKIDEILSLPHIINENTGLIDALSRLKDCWFYAGIPAYAQFGERATVDRFDEGVYAYYKLFVELKKMSGDSRAKIHIQHD